MPVVPVDNQTVQSAPIKTVFQSSEGATAGLFGADQARALQQGGAQLQQAGHDLLTLATKEQIEDNERAAKSLDIAYQGELLRLGMGDKNNPGYYTLQGENAVAGYEAHGKAVEEARRKITEGVSNSRVLKAFSAQADQRDLQENRTREAHLVRQREVANDAVYAGRVDAAKVEMSVYWNNPERVNSALEVIQGEASSYADRKGLVGEAKDFEIRKQQAAGVEGAVKAALANEDEASANALFSEHYNRLDPQQRASLAVAIRETTMDAHAQRLSDEVRRLNLSSAEARKWIEQHAKPGKERTKALEVYNASVGAERADQAYEASVSTRAWVETQRAVALDKQQREEAERKNYDEAYKLIDGGASFMSLSPEMRRLLSSDERTTLSALAVQIASGKPTATNDARFVELMGMSDADKANIDLATERLVLSDADFNIVRAEKIKVIEGTTGEAAIRELISAEAQSLGLTEAGNKEEHGKFLRLVQDEIDAAKAAKGDKRLTRSEVKDIINGIVDTKVSKGGVTGLFGGTTVPFKRVLSAEDRQKARADLRAEGVANPTELQILKRAAPAPITAAERTRASAMIKSRSLPMTEENLWTAVRAIRGDK